MLSFHESPLPSIISIVSKILKTKCHLLTNILKCVGKYCNFPTMLCFFFLFIFFVFSFFFCFFPFFWVLRVIFLYFFPKLFSSSSFFFNFFILFCFCFFSQNYLCLFFFNIELVENLVLYFFL